MREYPVSSDKARREIRFTPDCSIVDGIDEVKGLTPEGEVGVAGIRQPLRLAAHKPHRVTVW